MQKNVIIGIAIIIILIIIIAVSLGAGQKSANTRANINCDIMCFQIGSGNWIFPGMAGSPTDNGFSIKEDCVAACQARFPR